MLTTQLPPSAEEVDRHPVDVAAVEEDDRAVGHVGGRLVEDLLQRQEAVLDRQRELLRREEHHRVLAELGQQVVHAEQRAERVAVGALVGGEQEAVAARSSAATCSIAAVATPGTSFILNASRFTVLLEQPRDPHAPLDGRS